MNEELFWKKWPIFTGEYKEKTEADVRMLKSRDFKNKSIEDLTESICKKYQLEVPTLDMNETNWKKESINIVGDHVDVSIPFSGDGIFFYVQPPDAFEYTLDSYDAHDLQQLEVNISDEYCTLSFPIDNDTEQKMKRVVDIINSCLDVQRKQYGEFLARRKEKIQEEVENRKKQI